MKQNKQRESRDVELFALVVSADGWEATVCGTRGARRWCRISPMPILCSPFRRGWLGTKSGASLLEIVSLSRRAICSVNFL